MYAGRQITVLGAGRSGRAAATLALRLGADVVLSDYREDLEPLEGVKCCFGGHPESILDVDIVVVSPGIPSTIPPIVKARQFGAEVIGELAFAWRSMEVKPPLLAVTGTNGKSTVTSFAGDLCRAAGLKAFVGGNLGTPLSEGALERWDALVVEVSSYQMELPGELAPKVAVWLNITPDHLARHGTMECYAEHKARLLRAVGPDGVVIKPAGDPLVDEVLGELAGRVVEIGGVRELEIGAEAAVVDGHLLDLTPVGEGLQRWNAAVAARAVLALGVPPERLDLTALQPLPHRMESLGSVAGVEWINDSKATNVEATVAGLSGLQGSLVALLGGAGKSGADYSSIGDLLRGRGRAILFGASAAEISRILGDEEAPLYGTMGEAVDAARALARGGERVVLSPACASFDEFQNYEHRGDRFREMVAGFAKREVKR